MSADRTPRPCDPLHSAWAAAYLRWDEAELDRLDAELVAHCEHPQHEAGR